MTKGYFITLEGGEGCGKSTQSKLLQDYFKSLGLDFIYTREPGGCELSEKIRDLLLHTNGDMVDRTEFLLFSAARAQLVQKVIKPALEEGKIVLCDRFYDSSVVYQGIARGLGEQNIRTITEFAIDGLKPDCTIYYKIDPQLGFERKGGADLTDRIEMAGLAFHKLVFDGYNKLAESEPERIAVVDATKTIDEVFADTLIILEERGILVDKQIAEK